MVNLDKYFSDNYKLITEWTNSIYGRTEIYSGDVISELYLDLRNRELPTLEKEMKFYILRWLKSRTYWKGGNAIKNYRIPENQSSDNILADILIYEMEDDEISKDLSRAGFDSNEIDKITSCLFISKKMPLYFKRLFVLYYIDGRTMEWIGNSCGLPKSAVFTQLKKIQKFLKSELKLEQNNEKL